MLEMSEVGVEVHGDQVATLVWQEQCTTYW
jgi:hypothetical protein